MTNHLPAQTDVVLPAFRESFETLERLARTAFDQVDDEHFFRPLDDDANSVALLVKHVGGNLWSRWTEPFTSDGEKRDRHRDREFEIEPGDTRASLLARWDEGWRALRDTLVAATDSDLGRTLSIRGEPHTFARALARSLAHTAGHAHQVVLLCRHWSGTAWRTPSIPRGQSESFRPGGTSHR